jgi:hypothetical protein
MAEVAMRIVAAALLALSVCAGDALAAGDDNVPVVSMIDLLANKEKYEGKRIQVSGFLAVLPNDEALYLDEYNYSETFAEKALWLPLGGASRSAFKDYSRRSGYVTGVFRSDGCNGPQCTYAGRLENAKLGTSFK